MFIRKINSIKTSSGVTLYISLPSDLHKYLDIKENDKIIMKPFFSKDKSKKIIIEIAGENDDN